MRPRTRGRRRSRTPRASTSGSPTKRRHPMTHTLAAGRAEKELHTWRTHPRNTRRRSSRSTCTAGRCREDASHPIRLGRSSPGTAHRTRREPASNPASRPRSSKSQQNVSRRISAAAMSVGSTASSTSSATNVTCPDVIEHDPRPRRFAARVFLPADPRCVAPLPDNARHVMISLTRGPRRARVRAATE